MIDESLDAENNILEDLSNSIQVMHFLCPFKYIDSNSSD